MYENTRYLLAGDKGIVIEFGDDISPETSERVRGMMVVLEDAPVNGIITVIPTYRSLMVQYEPTIIKYKNLLEALMSLEENIIKMDLPGPHIFEVPTVYGGEFGPDIGFVAEHNNITVEQVKEIHQSQEYLVYMLGFTPGFSYLGGMDSRIATPRLSNPRVRIPGGSVGIAASQTGIYSIESPGGWQLIGKTPLQLYDPHRNPPILHKSGDYIKFVEIDYDEYGKIEEEIAQNTYEYKLYER